MRNNFDEHLQSGINVKYNEEFGSFIEEKGEVIVSTNKNTYSCKFLVGADGIGS